MRPTQEATLGASGSRARRERGFTLIEIIVVLAIVGVVLSLTVLYMDRMSQKHALRAAAREVGGLIDLARGTAAGRGTRTAIEYDLDGGIYQLYGQPKDGSRGNGPWGLEPVGGRRSLPFGVRFAGFYAHVKGESAQRGGVMRVRFDPLSIDGSHIVYLEYDPTTLRDLAQQKTISIKYNALLGSCVYVDGTAEFETPADAN